MSKTTILLDRFDCGCGIGSVDGIFGYDPCEKAGCKVAPMVKELAQVKGMPIVLMDRAKLFRSA